MKDRWSLTAGVTYLNHGSFGPSPRTVQQARQEWSARVEAEPMDFFLRRMEDHLDAAVDVLAQFVGADANGIVFVDNATVGMNIVAANTELRPGDEVLLTDREYGAVVRLWRERCRAADARLVVRPMPHPIADAEELVASFLQGVTDRTRLVVASHVTSSTATRLPVERICGAARERGVPVCIDGPHALAMVPLELERLGCDFYTASCHKWLSAPFGSGFLYVARHRRYGLKPAVVSWGGSLSGRPASWKDEFQWTGTRDPAAFLSVPAAIEFLSDCGVERFRTESHDLARYARQQITAFTGLEAITPDSEEWYGSMVSLPLPTPAEETGRYVLADPLQEALWSQFKIEIPVINWRGQRLLRVSCHLYNSRDDIDLLVAALRELL
jgi:isopenicillin-N epimerase